jgi:hypothetical protein
MTLLGVKEKRKLHKSTIIHAIEHIAGSKGHGAQTSRHIIFDSGTNRHIRLSISNQ